MYGSIGLVNTSIVAMRDSRKILFVVNVDWFFVSHRLPIAIKAIADGYDVHVATSYTNHRQYLESLGIVTHIAYFNRSKPSVIGLLDLFLLFFRLSPSIVHLITMQPIILGGFLSFVFPRTSYVYSISGFGHVFYANSMSAKIRRAAVSFLYYLSLHLSSRKHIIVQNERDYNFVLSLLIDKSLVTKIPGSGVDTTQLTPTPIPPNPPVLIFISRLLYTKGLKDFVDASFIVLRRFPDSKFIIVGSPDVSNPASVSQQYLTLISQLEHIILYGHTRDIAPLLSKSHVLVLPSYYSSTQRV